MTQKHLPILFLFIYYCWAADPISFKEWNQNQAPTLLLKRSQEWQNKLPFKSAFSIDRQIQGLNQTIRSNGVLYIDFKKGFLWKQFSTNPTTILIQKDHVWQINTNGSKELLSNHSQFAQFGEIINSLTKGDLSPLHRNFNISWLQDQEHWTLNLQAKGMASYYIKEVKIYGGTNIDSISIKQNTSITLIRFGSPREAFFPE